MCRGGGNVVDKGKIIEMGYLLIGKVFTYEHYWQKILQTYSSLKWNFTTPSLAHLAVLLWHSKAFFWTC